MGLAQFRHGNIMLDWRTLGLALVAFSASFAVGWWLGIGRPAAVAGATEAKPAALQSAVQSPPAPPSAVKVAANPAQPTQSAVRRSDPPMGKGLTQDDGLRQAVILRAKAYQRPACNTDPKSLYVAAATRYAEALMRSAGCNNFPKCPMGMGTLKDVWQLNRSVADLPVAVAMAAVNAAGGLSEKDFRGDVGRAVQVIAGTGFSAGPPPACESAGSRSGRWRIRIRR